MGFQYAELLRQANFDKSLGIVLTPSHIADLFVELADVEKESIVFDNCAGTGGFLVAAMKRMVEGANGDPTVEANIKSKGVIGIEQQPHIYSLAVANMFMHGDGKSRIEAGDCFDKSQIRKFKGKKPNVGILNPPFKGRNSSDPEELEFVMNNLECLTEGATCIAVLPMRVALGTDEETNKLKEKILTRHTLEAVLSLPNDLFHNSDVKVVTCAMVFTAKKPHDWNAKKVFFGYFKEDGHIVTRKGGRGDAAGHWDGKKKMWVDLYRKRRASPGLSVLGKVEAGEDWIAERMMKTNLNSLNHTDFERILREYSVYLFGAGVLDSVSGEPWSSGSGKPLGVASWEPFKYSDLFAISGSKTTSLDRLEESLVTASKSNLPLMPYVTTATANNGVRGYFPGTTEDGGVITLDSTINGFSAYQHWAFSASDHVEKLKPKGEIGPCGALFLVTLLDQERFRYNYGHKCTQSRMRHAWLRVPVDAAKKPDWKFMEDYIKERRFSKNLSKLPLTFPSFTSEVKPGLIHA